MQRGKPHAYPAAVAAFGEPTKLATEFIGKNIAYQERTAGFCHVTWSSSGITVSFFAFSGWWPQSENDPPAPKIRSCAAEPLATADFRALSVFAPKWHTRRGIRVGSPLPPGVPSGVRQEVPSSRHYGTEQLAL